MADRAHRRRTPERPLNIAIWGGQTDLAQALWRVKQDRGDGGTGALRARLRVYDIADQDGIAEWMRTEFPGMFYILAKAPAGRDRREAHLSRHVSHRRRIAHQPRLDRRARPQQGPLGALYPMKTWTAPNPHALHEGRRHAVVVLLPPARRQRSGRPVEARLGRTVRPRERRVVSRSNAEPGKDLRDTVSRWRPEFQRDFAKRMAWCMPGGAAMAANWPQWRGPSGLGVSAESDLPTAWSSARTSRGASRFAASGRRRRSSGAIRSL